MHNIYRIPGFYLFLLPMLLLNSGCADLSYYLHSINGHLSIVNKTQPIDELLASDATDEKLVERLLLVNRIREFAFTRLHLPRSDSYSEYADLERAYVLKNLFAAGEFSTAPYQWCYPVVGCAGYRGYFDDQRLQRYVARLEAQNHDIYIARVPAYSTLGWFDDPVLNTFVHWPEYRLAGLIFHELSHQKLFIDGDSHFNESFAVAVQQLGVEHWYRFNNQPDKLRRYRALLENRQQVITLIERSRHDLDRLYNSNIAEKDKRQAKHDYLYRLKNRYRELSTTFEVQDGFKRWFAGELNNAKLLSVSTYHALVPAFRNLFTSHHGDFHGFYAHVEAISRLDSLARNRCLQFWLQKRDAQIPASTPADQQLDAACIEAADGELSETNATY